MLGYEFSTERGRRAILRVFLRNLGTRDTQRLVSSPSAIAQPENDTTLFSGANASIWIARRFVGGRDASPKTHCLTTATSCQTLSLPISGRSRAVGITSASVFDRMRERSSPTTRTSSLSPQSNSTAGMLSS